MAQTKHDRTAEKIARQKGAPYNRGQGPDVQTPTQAIEVETKATVSDGFRQLRGFRRSVYIAGADDAATKAALEATKGTTVGVMSPDGKIVKRSTRKTKRATCGPCLNDDPRPMTNSLKSWRNWS